MKPNILNEKQKEERKRNIELEKAKIINLNKALKNLVGVAIPFNLHEAIKELTEWSNYEIENLK